MCAPNTEPEPWQIYMWSTFSAPSPYPPPPPPLASQNGFAQRVGDARLIRPNSNSGHSGGHQTPCPRAQTVNQQVICTWCILIGAQRAPELCVFWAVKCISAPPPSPSAAPDWGKQEPSDVALGLEMPGWSWRLLRSMVWVGRANPERCSG